MVANGVEEFEGSQAQVAQLCIGPCSSRPFAECGRPESAVAAMLGDPRRHPVHGPRVVEAGAS
eukprot:3238913-Lingulodinium_polyedra.AAC.1